jgi:Fe2+ or Zn2+ uptake regulation protein
MKSRQTRQKELLSKEAGKLDSFFTAQALCERARKSEPSIGIATVYRFLKRERFHSYSCGSVRVYSKEESSHCHFTCQKCGTVAHIPIRDITPIQKSVKGTICHFQIDVSGLCEKCCKSI